MSSSATSAAAVAVAVSDSVPDPSPVTFWCHECDMSVSLLPPSPSPPLCPHCHSLFLEHMDDHHHHLPSQQQTLISLTDSSDSSDDDDNAADNSPPPTNPNPNPTAYLHRLIQHLAGDDLPLPIPLSRGPSPAPRSSIDALPTVPVSDPSLLCAVCKDDFTVGSPVRKLPCSHLYHSDCIVPWLSVHNSCPLCRSPLPSEPSPTPSIPPPLANDLRGVFRHMTRRQRHRIIFPVRRAAVGDVAEVDATAGMQAVVGGGDGAAVSPPAVRSREDTAE
ncbi:putative E3 ubiquitin-protein ligase RING1 [Iris pallida]|uniref:RING-type E3 ubiquitin transferase n=1 Tax=Iris pallida TaxID=29817 RepID=A0AAX6E9X4_IRIPA|nr:putative E3 ubiquitin-protein ligase RING1 [Iris pallida]